ncbi:DUF3800 domain-containing protein [Adlercreutzia sp. ZJ304]|nr:DUF3800 domain-containing protein [Adlercreutzia sp. ZJ304]
MDSKSDFGLQAADYCSWALFRTWSSGECRYRNIIGSAIAQETDILADRKMECVMQNQTGKIIIGLSESGVVLPLFASILGLATQHIIPFDFEPIF